MSLIDRLRGFDDSGELVEGKLPVHQFNAAVMDFAIGGGISEADLKSEFGIVDGDDLSEWNWLKGKYQASADKPLFREAMDGIFMLIERNLFYNTKSAITDRINALP